MVTRCRKITIVGELPEGYPYHCCNCKYVGDKEECPMGETVRQDVWMPFKDTMIRVIAGVNTSTGTLVDGRPVTYNRELERWEYHPQ